MKQTDEKSKKLNKNNLLKSYLALNKFKNNLFKSIRDYYLKLNLIKKIF